MKRLCLLKSKVVLLFILFQLSQQAQATRYSLVGVANVSQLNETSTLGSVKGDGLLDWAGGLLLEFDLASSIGFESGLLYYKRTFGFENDKFSGTSIGIPLSFRLWFSDELNLSLGLFADFSVGDWNRQTNAVTNIDNSFSSFNYGWLVAFGYDYPIYDDTGFITEFRYQSDLSNRSTTSGVERKLSDYQLFFGIRFGRQGSMSSSSFGSSTPRPY